MTRPLAIPLLGLALSCLGGCGPCAPNPPSSAADDPRPHVVIVTLDTTRADHLGLYGYPRPTSPNLDALGEGALVFDRLVVPMATTLPTHTSLFTGVWPLEHGITANLKHGGERFVPSEALTPFASWAASRGYDTAGFVSAAVLRAETGIASGFATFDSPTRHERRARPTMDLALTWLQGRADEATPALLWVHLFDPHNPYVPPPRWRQAFEGDDPARDAWIAQRQHAAVGTRPTGEVVHTVQAIDRYDAEIAYMDQQLARLFDGIEAHLGWDRTALVVAGDHGEGLNQHGEPGHGLEWDEQLHAPLVMRLPGVAARRVSTVLSAADVLPTLLGQLDLPDEAAFLDQASGMDVLADGFEERPVLSMRSMRQSTLGKPLVWTLTGPHDKCHLDEQGLATLYDLDHDPHELSPLAEPSERLDACTAALVTERDRQLARQVQLGAGRTARMSEAELEALEALGYVHPEDP